VSYFVAFCYGLFYLYLLSLIAYVKVVAATTGPTDLDAVVSDKGDGTFAISYTPTIVGEYSIEVSLHNTLFYYQFTWLTSFSFLFLII
jgi:hypothetical protein